MEFTVEFANGTAITDKFSDKDDFNLWIKNAIADFGDVVYIEVSRRKRMTKAEAVKYFHESNKPFSDYWAMQLAWTQFVDDLKISDAITNKQRDNWGNPCTPETFKRFNQIFTGNF